MDKDIAHWVDAAEEARDSGDEWQALAFMRTANHLIVEHAEER